MKSFILKILQYVWRQIIPQALKSRIIPVVNRYHSERIKKNVLAKIAHIGQTKHSTAPLSGPLTVSGFFDEPLGIGRAGHCSFDALQGAGLNPVKHYLRPILNTHAPYTHQLPDTTAGGVHFIHCNPPEVIAMIRALHPDSYASKYRIGYWAYELSDAPQDWIDVSHFFHEIWVPSEFVKSALKAAHCPVRVMPHDVLAALGPTQPNYKKFGTSKDRFTILAAGDLRSSATRKNLEGSLDIYIEAFPYPIETIELVIKLSATAADAAAFDRLKRLTQTREDVHLIADDLAYEDMLSLITSSDLFLSPHRSEGFGLMLAEALALGKAVLATGWSGNMEFMSDIPQALFTHKMVAVQDRANIYSGQNEQLWAEVDIKEAAEKLRAIAANDLQIDFQPALERLQTISELWGRSSLQAMPFTNWVKQDAPENLL